MQQCKEIEELAFAQDSVGSRRPRTCVLMGLKKIRTQSQWPMLRGRLDQGTLYIAANLKK